MSRKEQRQHHTKAMIARQNIIAFAERTGGNVFSHADVSVNHGTTRKLMGLGFIVRYGTEKTETSQKKTHKLIDREIRRMDGAK